MRDKNKSPWKLILASSSPRRRELLGHTQVPFEILTIPTNEESHELDPRAFALDVARQKGVVVCESLKAQSSVVISADTVVALEGKIYGKPQGIEDARRILTELAGQTHQVHTGLCIHFWQNQSWKRIEHVETTEVDFLPLNQQLLESYLSTRDSLDKAGAYGIQGQALTFISGIRGCYANVVGFPLFRFCSLMEDDFLNQISNEGPWQNLFV